MVARVVVVYPIGIEPDEDDVSRGGFGVAGTEDEGYRWDDL